MNSKLQRSNKLPLVRDKYTAGEEYDYTHFQEVCWQRHSQRLIRQKKFRQKLFTAFFFLKKKHSQRYEHQKIGTIKIVTMVPNATHKLIGPNKIVFFATKEELY